MIGRITAEKCHICKMNCPQENLAKSCAEGRMYATQEVVRLQKELEVYKAIGTPEECRKAMEKQKPKKVINNTPTDDDIWYQCPTCNGDLTHIRGFYCSYCGQRLDWSYEE